MKRLFYLLGFVFIFASTVFAVGCASATTTTTGNAITTTTSAATTTTTSAGMTTTTSGAVTTSTIGNIAVSSITISGAGDVSIIDVLGGTLQMSAAIMPANATNKSVVWTVSDGTGTATINSLGVLTAITNGTVTVRATSVSNNNVSGTKEITITNQAAVDMNSTLSNLTVDGIMVMGFTPLHLDYVMVLASGSTDVPVTVATKYQSTGTEVITPASDVTSDIAAERTTTVVVTSEDTLSTKTYTILFETSIAPVDLGTADNYVILAQTGISTATSSQITGNIGVSPAAATYITGFSLIMDSTGFFSTSSQVTGNIYSSDYTSPTPSELTSAISDMQTAYIDAAGRAANYNELYNGDLSGKTLTTGVYKYGNSVLINTDLTLTGNATDIWIFQISGSLTQAANTSITLTGGALAENVFWQVADTVSIGTGASFEGVVLAMTNISVGTNASINGQLYAQTAVTLDANIIVKP